MSQSGDNAVKRFISEMPKWAIGLMAGGALVFVALAVGFVVASQPEFLGGYHRYEREFETLEKSAHAGLRCDQCHADPRGPLVHNALLVGEFYRGLVRKPAEPAFVKVATPSNAACNTCHFEDWSDDASRTLVVPHPAHLRVATEKRECVTCHKWTAHEEEYVERHKKMPFSAVCASFGCHVGYKQKDQCLNCHHTLSEKEGEWKETHKETVREAGPNGCLERCHDADQCRQCHTTGKRPQFEERFRSASQKAIEREHVKKDWIEKHGSLARTGPDKCLTCHVSKGECDDCHSQRPDFHGSEKTWLTRHQKIAEADEARCLVCHEKSWCEECHEQFKEMR